MYATQNTACFKNNFLCNQCKWAFKCETLFACVSLRLDEYWLGWLPGTLSVIMMTTAIPRNTYYCLSPVCLLKQHWNNNFKLSLMLHWVVTGRMLSVPLCSCTIYDVVIGSYDFLESAHITPFGAPISFCNCFQWFWVHVVTFGQHVKRQCTHRHISEHYAVFIRPKRSKLFRKPLVRSWRTWRSSLYLAVSYKPNYKKYKKANLYEQIGQADTGCCCQLYLYWRTLINLLVLRLIYHTNIK